ncbi:MAG: HlyC/CorC family transporter [Alphaproteobacteria bacterium]|nr:HlyC/CorC family transporter [Alphaproteobacteria bacterium]
MNDPLSPPQVASFAPESPKENAKRPSLVQSVREWLRHALTQRHDGSLKEALEEVIEEHEEQNELQMTQEERLMLHNVLHFGETLVSDIMIPRTDIAAVAHDITFDALKAHISEQRHTRIPVYQDTLDHVLGFLHVKDLLPMLAGDKKFDLSAVIRNVLFVPPSMPIIDLLVRMRHAGSHISIVVDEYGGTDGLVTMEDLFEEIVGEIQDEHDEDEESDDKITRLGGGAFEVSARIHIETLEKELGLGLVTEEKADDFDTLGGLIFFQLGRVPAKGEKVESAGGISFEILDADPRRIHKVRIRTLNQGHNAA